MTNSLGVSLVVLAFCGCGGKLTDSSSPNPPPSPSGDAGAAGLTTLLLQAFGGGPGEVAAQVPLLEPGVGLEMTCAVPVTAGACQLTSCQLGGIGSPGFGYGNFGPISATVGATTVSVTYDGAGYGTVYFPSSVTLGEGGTMTFRGGKQAGVPAFDVSVIVPGLAALTSPAAATDGGVATIAASQDLPVTWAPISIGQVQFHLEGGDRAIPGGTAISIACTFDGVAGAGVVPGALIASMKEMAGASSTYAYLSSELDATTAVGGLTIQTQGRQNSSTVGREFQVILQ
jgi:hypothetical protein